MKKILYINLIFILLFCTVSCKGNKKYTPICMNERNKFMVDNCSLLLSYLRRDFGGTFHTVEYAKKQSIQILNV